MGLPVDRTHLPRLCHVGRASRGPGRRPSSRRSSAPASRSEGVGLGALRHRVRRCRRNAAHRRGRLGRRRRWPARCCSGIVFNILNFENGTAQCRRAPAPCAPWATVTTSSCATPTSQPIPSRGRPPWKAAADRDHYQAGVVAKAVSLRLSRSTPSSTMPPRDRRSSASPTRSQPFRARCRGDRCGGRQVLADDLHRTLRLLRAGQEGLLRDPDGSAASTAASLSERASFRRTRADLHEQPEANRHSRRLRRRHGLSAPAPAEHG